MENCSLKRRFFSVVLLICLANDFNDIALDEMGKYLELPQKDVQKLMDTLKQVFITEGIFLWSSGDATEEKIAVTVTLLKVVKMQALSHLLVDAPIGITKNIIKGAVKIARLVGAKDISLVIEELEKESVKMAVEYGMKSLFQNQIKVTPGAINFKYYSYKGGEKEITLQYVMIYKPDRDNNRAEVEIRFYMPNSIESPDAQKNRGITSLPVPDLKKDISPFIVEINGIVEKNKFDNYQWVNEKGEISHPLVNITFSDDVPDFGIKPLSVWEYHLLKPFETKIREIEVIITKVTGKSLGITEIIHNLPEIAFNIWDKIKSGLFKFNPFEPAIVKQGIIEQEVIEVKPQSIPQLEKIVEQGTVEGTVEVRPQQFPKPKSEVKTKLTLAEIQEKLDDIAERIDIINQEAEKLIASKIASGDVGHRHEEVGEVRLHQPKIEEIEEDKQELEEQKQEKEPEQEMPVIICAKSAGSAPTRNKIIFNEIAWMGTTNSHNDEWIELKNISGQEINLDGWQVLDKENQIKIIFGGGQTPATPAKFSANGFFLLERTDDNSVQNIVADFIYTGSLSNSNEALYLFDENCQLQDEVVTASDWPSGDNSSKRTMERKSDLTWQTSANPCGTPKTANSSGYYAYSSGGSSFDSGSSGNGDSTSLLSDTQAPVAQAGSDQTVIINQPINFDASQSSDNIKITSYKWDINQDSTPDLQGKKATYKDGYQIPGEYIVTLYVSDKVGNEATDTLTITVIQPRKILISEIQIEGVDSKDEFIELYNPNDINVNLHNWALKKKTSGGNEGNLVSSAYFSGTVPALGYFLIVPKLDDENNPQYQGEAIPDLYYSGKDYSVADNNTILLYDQNGNLIDKVGFGQAQDFETATFAQNPKVRDPFEEWLEEIGFKGWRKGSHTLFYQSLGRKINEQGDYQDTDNNAEDFELQDPTPKHRNQTFSHYLSTEEFFNEFIPPETEIISNPLLLTNQTEASFEFSADKQDCSFQCQIDEQEPEICLSPKQYTELSDGIHIFKVYAIDSFSNSDETPAEYQWEIDNTPPQTEILAFPPLLTNQTQASFTFSASEENCVFECQINEENWQTCVSPKIYENLTDNEYTFSVRATDLAGNLETNLQEHKWTIDTEIKSASLFLYDLDSGSLFYTNESIVNITILDDEEAIAWLLSETQIAQPEINNSDWLPPEKPATFILSDSDGAKTVYIWTKDGLNVSQLGNSASIVLDTIIPEINLENKPSVLTNQTSADFTFSANEQNCVFRCQLNDNGWESCVLPTNFSDLFEGGHTFQIQATDLAGNNSETLNYSWTIDITPPEVCLNEIFSPQTQLSFVVLWTGQGEFQFRYSDDAENWAYYPSASEYTAETLYNFTGEDEQTYYFQVKAKDQAGNETQWSPELPMSVKISLPKPILEINKNSLKFEAIEFSTNPENQSLVISNTGNADLQWESFVFPITDWLNINPISNEISPDNSAEISISTDITGLDWGKYYTEITLFCEHSEQNVSISLDLKQDTVPPETILSQENLPLNYTGQTCANFSFSANETSLFKCQIDALDWKDCESIKTYTDLFEGGHTFQVKAIDLAGNSDLTPATYSWIIDFTPPIADAGQDQTIEINQAITFNGSDSSDNVEIVSYKWDIDNDQQWDYEDAVVILEQGFSEIGGYLVILQVSDAAGNTSIDNLLVTVVEPDPTLEVVINEIAWAGTSAANSSDEWIELYNNTNENIEFDGWTLKASDGTPEIVFSGIIPSENYFLLERTDNNSISDILADQIYTGGLNNEGEKLELRDADGKLIDLVDCSDKWFAGEANPNYISMERVSMIVSGSDPDNWASNNLITRAGLDANGNKINGTPKQENSVSKSQTEISSDLPFSDEISEITLTKLGAPYIIQWMLQVPQGKTLKIDKGVVIKFKDVYSGIQINGTLNAIGTGDEKIIFTSNYNDLWPGRWKQICFSETSIDSVLDYVVVEYGGRWPTSDAVEPKRAAIRVEKSSITLSNSVVDNNKNRGLYLIDCPSTTIIDNVLFSNQLTYNGSSGGIGILIDGGSPTIKNSDFNENITGIEIRQGSSPQIDDNIFKENEKPIYVYNSYPVFSNNQTPGNSNNINDIFVFSIDVNQDYTLKADLDYIINDKIVVAQNVILTIESGVVMKFKDEHSGMRVNGTLKAIGTNDEKIIFTSNYTNPWPGSWKQIYFSETSIDSVLDYVVVRYGGRYPTSDCCSPYRAAIRVKETSITLKNSIIENNMNRGLYLIDSLSIIDNVRFLNHQVGCDDKYIPVIALLIDGGSATIKNCVFSSNTKHIEIYNNPTLNEYKEIEYKNTFD